MGCISFIILCSCKFFFLFVKYFSLIYYAITFFTFFLPFFVHKKNFIACHHIDDWSATVEIYWVFVARVFLLINIQEIIIVFAAFFFTLTRISLYKKTFHCKMCFRDFLPCLYEDHFSCFLFCHFLRDYFEFFFVFFWSFILFFNLKIFCGFQTKCFFCCWHSATIIIIARATYTITSPGISL